MVVVVVTITIAMNCCRCYRRGRHSRRRRRRRRRRRLILSSKISLLHYLSLILIELAPIHTFEQSPPQKGDPLATCDILRQYPAYLVACNIFINSTL